MSIKTQIEQYLHQCAPYVKERAAAQLLMAAKDRIAEFEDEARRFNYLLDMIEWYPPRYDGSPFGRFELFWRSEDRDLRAAIDAAMEKEKQ